MQRLDKILSSAGAGSRKDLRAAIRAGVEAKPLRHRLAETGHSGALRNMNEIGG